MKKIRFNKGTLILFILLILINFMGCKQKDKGVKTTENSSGAQMEQENETESTNEVPKEGEEIFTINDEKVFYNEMMIYIMNIKNEYEPSLGKDIWSFDMGDGKTFGDMAKEETLNQVIQLKVISLKAEELGVTLTDDEKTEMNQLANEQFNEMTVEDKKTYYINLEVLETVYSDNYLAEKVFEITTNMVNTDVPDDEAIQITIQHILIKTKGYDSNGEEVELTKEEKKDALKKAKSIRKKAKKAEDFKSFAEANTEDDEIEYTFGYGQMPKDIEEGAFALKKGEISQLIETSEGYYILYCVDNFNKDATNERKEEIIKERQEAEFASQYEKWLSEADLNINSKVWEQIILR